MYYIDLAVTGISFGCMYAMMSVGLTLVYGLLRILHVAHAAVFALGAYVTVSSPTPAAASRSDFLAAISVTPLFGMAIYRLLYEPLLKYRPDVPMIASVGLLVLMQDAFRIAVRRAGRHLSQQRLSRSRSSISPGSPSAPCRSRSWSAPALVFVGAASVHHAHAHRRRLARHRIEAADRRQLRRRRRSRCAI